MFHGNKALKNYSFLFFLFCFLAFLFPSVSNAEESLNDLHARLDSYLETPVKRAIVLQEELTKLNATEKTLASGFGIAVSDIYEYKAAITKAVAEYYLLDSIKTGNDKTKNITFMPNEVTKILSGKSFSFEDVVALLKAKHACHKTVLGYERDLTSRQETFNTAKEALNKIEIDYRQLSEKVDKKAYSSWDKDKFKLSKLKAELEAQSTNMAICKLYSNLVKDLLHIYQVQYEDLKIATNKCLSNSTRLMGETNFLDKKLEQDISWCWNEYAKVSGDKNNLKTLHVTSSALKTLQARLDALVNTDTLLLLSLAENWSYLSRNWYCLFDIIKGVLPIAKTDILQEYTNIAENFIQQSNQTALVQLNTLKNIRENILSLNSTQLTSEDRVALANFYSKTSIMLERASIYLAKLQDMSDQTQIIDEATDELVNKSDKKILYFSLLSLRMSSFLSTELFTLGEHPMTISKLLVAMVLLIVGYLISKSVSLRIKKRLNSDKNSASLQKLLSITIWFFTILVILWQLRIPITAFAFIGGYGALAIGIGMQRILGNAIAGIIILVQKRVRVGDMLTIDGTWGKVKEITLMNTVLSCALASEHVIIPNSKILDLSVKNHTWKDNFMRSLVYFWVSGEKDVENTKSVIEYVIAHDDSVVVKSRPYFIRVADLGNDSVKFEVVYFFDVTKFLPKDSQAVLREKIFTEFHKRGIIVRDQDTVIQMVTSN